MLFLGAVAPPSPSAVMSSFTDVFWPVLLPVLGVLGVIAVVFFVWRRVMASAGASRGYFANDPHGLKRDEWYFSKKGPGAHFGYWKK